MSKKLMIAGGGTGGHIYPAIAVAQEFMRRDPARQVVFVGTERGLEKTIVPKKRPTAHARSDRPASPGTRMARM